MLFMRREKDSQTERLIVSAAAVDLIRVMGRVYTTCNARAVDMDVTMSDSETYGSKFGRFVQVSVR